MARKQLSNYFYHKYIVSNDSLKSVDFFYVKFHFSLIIVIVLFFGCSKKFDNIRSVLFSHIRSQMSAILKRSYTILKLAINLLKGEKLLSQL